MSVIPVRFNVAQLLKSTVGAVRQYELDDDIAGIDPELEIVKPLQGKIRFLRLGDGILVTGTLHTTIRVSCRRCLELFDLPVSFELEEQFRPSIDVNTGTPIGLEDGEDMTTRIDLHHMLDLEEVVRQSLLLALPMSPLCKKQCRGLCPGCGANLNTETCTCQPEDGDPRLAALRELL
jgi:uncharacterized protein